MSRNASEKLFTEILRPKQLKDFVGNDRVFNSQAGLLVGLFKNANPDCPPSILIIGPPGTGKTSLARIYHLLFAQFFSKSEKQFAFIEFAANQFKKAALDDFLLTCRSFCKHPVIFIDEIHSLTSTQQTTFLSMTEHNESTLIAATTESVSRRIIEGLRSRLAMINLRIPDTKEVLFLLVKTLNTLKPLNLALPLNEQVDPKALCFIAKTSGGDFRKALQMLQNSIINRRITMQSAQLASEMVFSGGNTTDMFYDSLSGLQKSIRASDPQGAIFFLAVLLQSEADQLSICRRLIVIASEDVGLADPNALSVAVSCFHAVQAVGDKEGRLPLAECVIYLAKANKSNSSYMALANAEKWLQDNQDKKQLWRPRDGYTRSAAGEQYKYPHSLGGQILDSALQSELQQLVFYRDREW